MIEPVFQHTHWKWICLDTADPHETDVLRDLPPAAGRWAKSLHAEMNSCLQMEFSDTGDTSMQGSFVYTQDIEIRNEKTILHYFVTADMLLTYGISTAAAPQLSLQHLKSQMNSAENAVEGFMVLLGEITSSFLQGIELFEDRMHDLLWRIKMYNDEPVFAQIIDNRHEILVWKNLLIPVISIREAAQEAFGSDIQNGIHYQRTCRRLQRCRQTIREYDEEIGKLIDLESVISSHRGNEIVKTLTVITMLFTPVAAWGALWGMNFKIMPELKWKYGYIISLFVIFLSTWGLYYYLKKKNWIGSVLKSPKDEKF